MSRTRTLVAAVAGILAVASGCVSCRPEAARVNLEVGPECGIPAWERQRVYVFLVNGLTPSGMCSLRDRLNAQGFPKIAYGQMCHAVWMANEMRRIHADEPEARFVVVGYDVGGAVAARLAGDAAADGLPVDSLVLLDPVMKAGTETPVPTVVVCSKAAFLAAPQGQTHFIGDAGHFGLPAHPETVAVLVAVLQQSAAHVVRPAPSAEVTETYEHAAPSREIPAPAKGADPAWTFLLDLPGNHTTPLHPGTTSNRPVSVTRQP